MQRISSRWVSVDLERYLFFKNFIFKKCCFAYICIAKHSSQVNSVSHHSSYASLLKNQINRDFTCKILEIFIFYIFIFAQTYLLYANIKKLFKWNIFSGPGFDLLRPVIAFWCGLRSASCCP